MNKIKNMTLIFDWEWFERVHLYKDVGMIPIYLQRLYGIEANILFYSSQTNRDLKSKELDINLIRLNKNFLNKIKFLRRFITPMILYLIKNAKKTDMLMLFHIKEANFLYRKIYKFLNPKGKVYLKLDMDLNGLNWLEENYVYSKKSKKITEIRYGLKEYLKRFVRNFRIKKIEKQLELFDLVSVETNYAFEKLREILNDNINLMKVTNGFSIIGAETVNIKKFKEKENIIVTVGRIGDLNKNNIMLMNALKKIELKNWNVLFIGPIEKNFYSEIEDFFIENPNLKEKVEFIGNVKERKQLYEYYNNSKVFCFTSKSESFGLVLNEALYFGNYIISTNVGAIQDITNHEKLGRIIEHDDIEALAYELQIIIDESKLIENFYEEIRKNSTDNFIWDKIVAQLYERIE